MATSELAEPNEVEPIEAEVPSTHERGKPSRPMQWWAGEVTAELPSSLLFGRRRRDARSGAGLKVAVARRFGQPHSCLPFPRRHALQLEPLGGHSLRMPVVSASSTCIAVDSTPPITSMPPPPRWAGTVSQPPNLSRGATSVVASACGWPCELAIAPLARRTVVHARRAAEEAAARR